MNPGRGGSAARTLAIIALIVATAGWTTVAVMVVNGRPDDAVVETPTESLDPGLGGTAADLQVGQAYDPTGTLDLSAGIFRADGIAASDLQAQMIKAWQGDYPDLKVSEVTMGGRMVTKGDFDAGAIHSYWFVRDDVVFDVETSDEKLAEAAILAIPDHSAPAGSPQTSGSAAPAPSGSPAASGSPTSSPS